MKYILNQYYNVEINDKTLTIFYKDTKKEEKYTISFIKKASCHMGINQLFFNGIPCSLIHYLSTTLIPQYEQKVLEENYQKLMSELSASTTNKDVEYLNIDSLR
jgi:hypothetical protein